MPRPPAHSLTSRVSTVLRFTVGVGLVFLSHLLVGAFLFGGAELTGSYFLAYTAVLWATSCGGAQAIFVLPLYLVGKAAAGRPMANGVAVGAILAAILQGLVFTIYGVVLLFRFYA